MGIGNYSRRHPTSLLPKALASVNPISVSVLHPVILAWPPRGLTQEKPIPPPGTDNPARTDNPAACMCPDLSLAQQSWLRQEVKFLAYAEV